MSNPEQFVSLLQEIYDVVFDLASWDGVIKSSSEYIDAYAASIVVNESKRVHFNAGANFGGLEEAYRKHKPITPGKKWIRERDVISVAAAFPREELEQFAFYNEWWRPQGISDILTYGFNKAPPNSIAFRRIGSGAAFAFRAEDNSPPRVALPRMRLVMPHMRRAVLISNALKLGDAEAATFIHLLDGLRAGIFLIDAKQSVVHANASGQELLARREILRVEDGRLVANELDGGNMLEGSVARIAAGGSAAVAGAFAMPLKASDGSSYVAHLLPLTSRTQRRVEERSVAVLIVHQAGLDMPPEHRTFAQRYKLTPTEARVSVAIAEVGGIPEVADVLGLAPNTVRTHLQRVFLKTDLHRQAELVKLVASLASPLLR